MVAEAANELTRDQQRVSKHELAHKATIAESTAFGAPEPLLYAVEQLTGCPCTVAEEIGVIGQPEISTAILNSSHAFLVIATDGVWEFLGSQAVVDLVSLFALPLPGCCERSVSIPGAT